MCTFPYLDHLLYMKNSIETEEKRQVANSSWNREDIFGMFIISVTILKNFHELFIHKFWRHDNRFNIIKLEVFFWLYLTILNRLFWWYWCYLVHSNDIQVLWLLEYIHEWLLGNMRQIGIVASKTILSMSYSVVS
jgi:hypothetical protein